MAGADVDAELKRRLLRLLEEDEEFRLAVAGLVGLREILEELRELRRKSLEHDRRFEAIERKLLEHDEKFRAVLEEIKNIKEEIRKIWEAIHELNKRVNSLEDGFRVLERRVAQLGDMMGSMAESMYSKFFLDTVLYELAASGRRLEKWERNATVDGEEVDLLIVAEEKVYVVEVKIQSKHRDVGALLAKADVVARHYPGREVVPVLSGTRIGREVAEYARSKGVIVASW